MHFYPLCHLSWNLYFVLVAYFSGWRGNQKEAPCSVQVEQKKRKQDDTTSTKKKLWRFCLTRLKQNLKRKKEVQTKKAATNDKNRVLNGTCCDKLSFLGNRNHHCRRKINGQDITSLQDGEELYEAMGDDPAYLEVNFHLHKAKIQIKVYFVYTLICVLT